MLLTNSQSMLAPGIGDRILQVHNYESLPPYFVIGNRDANLSAAIEFVESDDGTTWSTIVGTSKSILPGQSSAQVVVSTRRLIALFAQGNVLLDVHVVRYRNGEVDVLN